jgi:hypothetical protein
MTTITAAERTTIDDAVAAGNVTKVKAGRAKGVNKKTAPMTMTKPTRAQRNAAKPTRSIKRKPTANKATKTASRPAGTFTTVDLAAEQGVNAKTLRARIRRNIDDWALLFVDGQRHVFKDNKTTRAKINELLA